VPPTQGHLPNVLPQLPGARLTSLTLAERGRPHPSFQVPPSQHVEAQGPEALLQLLAVHIGAVAIRQMRVSAEGDVVEDQAVSARVRSHLVHLAGTRRSHTLPACRALAGYSSGTQRQPGTGDLKVTPITAFPFLLF